MRQISSIYASLHKNMIMGAEIQYLLVPPMVSVACMIEENKISSFSTSSANLIWAHSVSVKLLLDLVIK